MNEENILQKLHRTINSSHIFTKSLSISDFMHFIVDCNSQNQNNLKEIPDSDTFSAAHLHNLYNMKNQLSSKELHHLCINKTWSLETLIDTCCTLKKTYNPKAFPVLIQKCRTLLTLYSPLCNIEQDFSDIIRSLVFLHFFGDPTPFVPNCPCLCQKYVSWNEMENKIRKNLEVNHLIFLTGNPGSGKRQLLIHSLQASYFSIGKDYYWLDTNSSIPLEEELTSLVFSGTKKSYNLEEVLNILRTKTKNSLLIIHRPILTDADLSFVNKTLIPMNLYIIISTYTKVSLKNTIALDVDNRPIANLFNIFKIYNPSSDFTEKEFLLLANHFSNNVYLITIIAKALSSKPKNLQKKQLIDQFESFYYECRLPKVHSFYHMDDIERSSKSGQQLLLLTKKLLSCYPHELFTNELSELSIWTKTPISYIELTKHFKVETLQIWIESGIIQYYDEDKIYMPSLIADIVWINYPINYTEYRDKLLHFILQIECGAPLLFPYETLYQVISNLIFRFHFQITIMPSRTSKKSIDLFLNWNNLLTNIMEHYMHLGNYIYAQKILPHLYIAYNKRGEILDFPSSLFSSQVKELLRSQADYMQSSDIISSFDNLINRIDTIKNNVTSLNKSSRSIINRLILSILQDLADTAVEIAIQYTRDYFFPYNVASNTQWNNCLYAIYNFADKFKIMGKNEEYYYKGIYYALITLYRNPDTLQKAKDNFRIFLFLETDVELRFKVKCIQFYFYILSATSFTPIPYSTLIQNFENLYIEFTNKIWSYHTSYIFYSCVSVLSFILPYCISDRLRNTLITCMKQCKKFYEKQLSLPSAQKEAFINLLNEKISEMSS